MTKATAGGRRSVAHIVKKLLSKSLPMSNNVSDNRRAECCESSDNFEKHNAQIIPLPAENYISANSFHHTPTFFNYQPGRGLQESIYYNSFPQSVMYHPTFPTQNWTIDVRDNNTAGCCEDNNNLEKHNAQIIPVPAENYISTNSFHHIPTFFNGQSGRGFQDNIHYNGLPQLVMYPNPTFNIQNYVLNPYSNYMQYYHTNFPPPPLNIYNYGADHTNSHGRYFHRNVDHRSRNRQIERKYEEDIMSVRLWQKVQNKPSSTPGFIFTLMSYNVLAQDLLEQHPFLYRLHDKNSLNWHIRWQNLLEEIKKFMPDILCLQEVQESHIEKYYSLLETLGYEGLYKKRTGNRSDGCAIYYKTDHVTLIDHSFVEYFQPIVSVLNRDNIGIVAKFAPKLHRTREFVIATTHLLYNPRRNDVRMAQMQLLLTEIEKFSYKMEEEKSLYLPVILTGDLNSPPDSDLYEFIIKGVLKYEQLSPRLLTTDPKSLNGRVLVTSSLGITDNCQHTKILEKRFKETQISEEKPAVDADSINRGKGNNCFLKSTGALSHDFGFNSVYLHDLVEITEHSKRRVKEGTTFQDEWLTVDYIFYSGAKEKRSKEKAKMTLLSRYRLPTTDELDNLRIPNQRLGSDHLSLAAKFKLEF